MTIFLGRKKSPLDPSCCPVCGITLRSSDLESHFVQEIERLERVSRAQRSTYNSSPSNLTTLSASSVVAAATSVSTTTQNSHKREQDSRTEVNVQVVTIQRFKNNFFYCIVVVLDLSPCAHQSNEPCSSEGS